MYKPTESNWRYYGFLLEWGSVFGGCFQWVLCCDRYPSFLLIFLLIKILFNKIIPFLQISMFKIHVRALCGVARGMNFRLCATGGGVHFRSKLRAHLRRKRAQSPPKDFGSPSKKCVTNDQFWEGARFSVRNGLENTQPSPAQAHEHQAQSNPELMGPGPSNLIHINKWICQFYER